jgi:SAM-dependent methyltransferase
MNHYFLLLGNAYQLAMAELASVLGRYSEPVPVAHHNLAEITTHLEAAELISTLGGTIKVYSPLPIDSTAVKAVVTDCLETKPRSLAFSSLDGVAIGPQAFQIKQELANQSLPVRFRLLQKPTDSAGILTKDVEYLLSHRTSLPPVLKCVAVQNIDRWSRKDYGRPQADPKSGMLPPKISRMLVNCGLSQKPTSATIVFDPMCGMGTILMEALDLGHHALGCDIDAQVIEAAQQNLDWFTHEFNPSKTFSLQVHNIQNPNPDIKPESIDTVVFEGYLGPPSIKSEKIDNYLKGLTKMYLGSFKHIHKYLKPKGIMVAAVPAYVKEGSVKTMISLIDRCEKLGYTPLYSDIFYYRPKATVRRQILIWQKA